MTSEKPSYRDLDNLLTGLELDILHLDDQHLEARADPFFGSVRSIRDVIATGLQSHVSVDRPSTAHGAARARRRPATPPRDTSAMLVPGSISEKRKLLAELFANSPGIPGQLRMAFSASTTLPDSEVEAMIERLVRLGILRRDSTDNNDA